MCGARQRAAVGKHAGLSGGRVGGTCGGEKGHGEMEDGRCSSRGAGRGLELGSSGPAERHAAPGTGEPDSQECCRPLRRPGRAPTWAGTAGQTARWGGACRSQVCVLMLAPRAVTVRFSLG